MIFVDTHTHLYLDAFDSDRDDVMANAMNAGVHYIVLPNIDSGSVDDLHKLADDFPSMCLPLMGLHPTSVKGNWEEELQVVTGWIETRKYAGIGEIGIDLYWDTSFREQQAAAFRYQLQLAAKLGLPVSIHSRNSMDLILDILENLSLPDLKGILHCFSGNIDQAQRALDLGFHFGIGGVITYKKSGLSDVVAKVPLKNLVLETDAPFLAPVPYRGKRNESSYLLFIADAIARIKHISLEEVAEVTTATAARLFNINKLYNTA